MIMIGSAAFVIFDGMDSLDFVGAYEAITQLRIANPAFRWDICAPTASVTDDRGQRFLPGRVNEPLTGYDLLLVPGGRATCPLRSDVAFLVWLRTGEAMPRRVPVCTGSLLFGGAGWLSGRRATTHPGADDLLAPSCAEVVADRIVDTGDIITGRGVSSLDVGLSVVERIGGADLRATVAKNMDYPS